MQQQQQQQPPPSALTLAAVVAAWEAAALGSTSGAAEGGASGRWDGDAAGLVRRLLEMGRREAERRREEADVVREYVEASAGERAGLVERWRERLGEGVRREVGRWEAAARGRGGGGGGGGGQAPPWMGLFVACVKGRRRAAAEQAREAMRAGGALGERAVWVALAAFPQVVDVHAAPDVWAVRMLPRETGATEADRGAFVECVEEVWRELVELGRRGDVDDVESVVREMDANGEPLAKVEGGVVLRRLVMEVYERRASTRMV